MDHAHGEGLQGFGQRFEVGAGCADALEREARDDARLLRVWGQGRKEGGQGGKWEGRCRFQHDLIIVLFYFLRLRMHSDALC